MNRDEEFLKAVSERKAPMALIPEDVVDAVAKRCWLAKKCQRIIHIVLRTVILIYLSDLAIVVMLWGCGEIASELGAIILLIVLGLPIIIISMGLVWCLCNDPRDIDHQQLPSTGCSLSGFADSFMPLMDAFGDDGKRMGDYTPRAIEIHAKAILCEYAQKAKRAQDKNPNDPLAGDEDKHTFRCLHALFARCGLNPGPPGPYFT